MLNWNLQWKQNKNTVKTLKRLSTIGCTWCHVLLRCRVHVCCALRGVLEKCNLGFVLAFKKSCRKVLKFESRSMITLRWSRWVCVWRKRVSGRIDDHMVASISLFLKKTLSSHQASQHLRVCIANWLKFPAVLSWRTDTLFKAVWSTLRLLNSLHGILRVLLCNIFAVDQACAYCKAWLVARKKVDLLFICILLMDRVSLLVSLFEDWQY